MCKFYKDMKIFDHDGYEEVYFPTHPNASSIGTIFVHRLVAEDFLGRYLLPQECVHHIDGIKNHNNINNLWIFKTTSDHIKYHTAIKNGSDFTLQRIGGTYTCNIIVSKEYYVCPNCGGKKSRYAVLCHSCTIQTHNSSLLDKDTLSALLQTKSYTEIGRQYGMTGNGIKKIAKRYGLYQRCFIDCPDVEKLVRLLKTTNTTEVAKQFNVSAATVHTWIKNKHICIKPLRYLCVETNDVFISKNLAAKQMYPQITYKIAAKYIGKCCVSAEAYHGYHWKMLDKEVYID